jgi:hypothetical protein
MTVKTAKESGLPLNIKPDTVLRYGLGGALTGGAVASALNLVHMLREMSRKRQAENAPSETDESTIVLTLPQKTAAVGRRRPQQHKAKGTTPYVSDYITDGNVGDYNASDPPKSEGMVDSEAGVKNDSDFPTTLKTVEGPNESLTRSKQRRQVRRYNGEYGIKTANWPTLTASLLAGGAGGLLGYRLVDKVFEIKRLKEKEKELSNARQEYLDMLAGSPKAAEVDAVFCPPMAKEAFGGRNRTFSLVDMPLGIAALAFLLGGGGSAYITKRILDKMDADRRPKEKKPSVKKIVFRSSPAPTEEGGVDSMKAAQAADEVFDAALGVYLDIASGQPAVLGDEKVAQAMQEAGVSAADMVPKKSTDFDRLLMTLEANPKLRQLMQGAMMENHPIAKYFKWAFKLPILRGMADRKLYSTMESTFRPGTPKTAEDKKWASLVKEAGILGPSLADVAASFYGSTLAERVKNEEPVEGVAPAEEEDPEARARTILGDLQISADDPAAAQFVLRNKKKIAAILQRLAEEGKI